MIVSRCQVKKKSAARAPRWKRPTTTSVSQLMPSPMVAERPMRSSCHAGIARAAVDSAGEDAAGIDPMDWFGTESGEETVSTDAIVGKILRRVATGPLYAQLY